MATVSKILLKSGLLATLTGSSGILLEGELGYTTDSKEVFVGDGAGSPILVGGVMIGTAAEFASVAAGVGGRVYYTTDTEVTYIDDGTSWNATSVTNLDGIADGTTYGRVKISELTTGFVSQVNDGVNTTTAAEIRSHVDDTDYHHLINDTTTTSSTELWSAQMIHNTIDSALTGISWKEPVLDVLASDAALTPASGDRYLVESAAATDGFVGEENNIATWNGSAWGFVTPLENWALFVANGDYALTYDLDTTAWIQFTGAGQVDAGVGLSKVGNTINVNMGAGIITLPGDEVGVDVATTGGLTVGAGGTADQLGITVDATTGATVAPLSVGTNGAGVEVDNDTIVHAAGVLAVGADSITSLEIDETDDYAFSGAVTAVTVATGTNDTSVATTAFVTTAVGNATATAGDGISITGATNITAVVADATGGANLAKSINVSANGVAIKIDNESIKEEAITGRLYVDQVDGGSF